MKTAPIPASSDPVPRNLIAEAEERITQWRKYHNLLWSDLYTAGLSSTSIKRVRNPTGYTFGEWVLKLVVLHRRMCAVADEKGFAQPAPWNEFFGPRFRLPPSLSSSAMFNRADIGKDRVTTLARPLIDFLLEEARAAKAKTNVWKSSEILNRACSLLELVEDWDAAATYLLELANINKGTGDFHFCADALLRRGQAQLYAGHPQHAYGTLQEGIECIERHPSNSTPHRVLLRLLNYLAIALMDLGRDPEARAILQEKSLPLARKHCSAAAVASVHNRLAVVFVKLNEPDAAFTNILSALDTRFDRKMFSEAARSLATLGSIHESRGEQLQAMLAWEVSFAWQSALGDKLGGTDLRYRLGKAYLALSQEASGTVHVNVGQEFFPNVSERSLLKKITSHVGYEEIIIQPERLSQQAIIHLKGCIALESKGSECKFTQDATALLRSIQ